MYKGIKYKCAIFSALILSIVIVVFASMLVWDVRVEGNESIPDERIELALSECGFDIGDLWIKEDKSKIENAVLAKCPELSWININRRGTVAYVVVSETAPTSEEESEISHGYANIVADADCVVEEITVTRGTATVKKGDSVKRGDILIAGIVSGENGGTLCYAEGSVMGRMSDTLTADVSRQYQKKVKSYEELISRRIKIFNFSLNIFKRYRNLTGGCDIIEDVKVFSLFGKHNLPISVISEYAVEYEVSEMLYDDAELVRLASSRLNSMTAKRLLTSDLIRLRTSGDYTDDGYRMTADIVFLTDVGKEIPFSSD